MENRIDTSDQESIGALLRRLRLERSLEISDVYEETRITPDIIRAMEADDFSNLPALAFARGFYGLYAAMLGLNQEEIMKRFLQEYRKDSATSKNKSTMTPHWQEGNVGSMASPPSYSIGTVIGIGLLFVLVIAIGASWYAGYNPASQASKWLRGFQTPPAEQSTAIAPTLPSISAPQADQPISPSQPAKMAPPAETTAPIADGYRYQLVAEFQESTTLTVKVDEDPAETVMLSGGTIKTWQAQESITVELPAGAAIRLFLNGIALPLPPPNTEGTVSLTIPEYLLD